ncbi:MAG: deoxyribonuclease IV [Chlamydiia bacterium]|nr:deoxyribonuclease IV [Chlamydiia bacterium]
MRHYDKVGPHLSVAKGFKRMLEVTRDIKATACQVFTSAPRRWNIGVKAKDMDIESVKNINGGERPVCIVSHASYLNNIASLDDDVFEKTILSLESEIDRCNALGIEFLVIHGGSAKNYDRTEAIGQIHKMLNYILNKHAECMPKLLIENSVRSKNRGKIADSIEDFREIFAGIDKKFYKKLGICIDFGHLFVSGIDIRDEKIFCEFFKDLINSTKLEKLDLCHISDNIGTFNSFKEVHASLGKGNIGSNFLSYIYRCKATRNAIKILETPNEGLFKHEIEVLRAVYIE